MLIILTYHSVLNNTVSTYVVGLSYVISTVQVGPFPKDFQLEQQGGHLGNT